MPRDGEIDFTTYSLEDLRAVRHRIARRDFPLNFARLEAELEKRGANAPPSEPEAPPDPLLARQRAELSEFNARLQALTPQVPVTITLIALNVLVFLAMGLAGVEILTPEGTQHVAWGSNFGPLTTGGEWWRLITSTFLHFGLVHLALNLFALWQTGPLVERLYGSRAYLAIYLLSGLAGSVASTSWDPLRNSAGASGAIFGVFGALLAFSLSRGTGAPKQLMTQHLTSTLLFVVYNVIGGLQNQGIDNAAHLGGLGAGVVLGLLLVRPIPESQRPAFSPTRLRLVAVVVLIMAGVGVASLQSSANRWANDLRFERSIWWMVETEPANLEQFNALQMRARAEQIDDAEALQIIENETLPYWTKARARFRDIPLPQDPARRAQQDRIERIVEIRYVGLHLYVQGIKDSDVKLAARGLDQFVNAVTLVDSPKKEP